MIVFLALLIWIALTECFSLLVKEKYRKVFSCAISFFGIFLVTFFENPISNADNANYLKYYQNYASGENLSSVKDLLFFGVMKIFAFTGAPYISFLFLLRAMNTLLIAFFVYLVSRRPGISAYLFCCSYLFPFSFVVLREYTALCFLCAGAGCFFALKGIKRYFLYFVFAICAILNHSGALLFAILVPFLSSLSKKIDFLFSIEVSVLLLAGSYGALYYGEDFLGLFYRPTFRPDHFSWRYLLFCVILTAFSFYCYGRSETYCINKFGGVRKVSFSGYETGFESIMPMLSSSVLWMYALTLYDTVLYRLSIYPLMIFFGFFPNFLTDSQISKRTKIAIMAFTFLVSIYTFYNYVCVPNSYGVYPYKSLLWGSL